MCKRSPLVVLVILVALAGCVRQDAVSQHSSAATSVPGSVQIPTTTVRASRIPATPTPSQQNIHATKTAARPAVTQVITPSVLLLSDAAIGLTAVSFVDAQHGWIGFGASILATNDGGQQWHTVYTATETISSLDFVSEQRGWAVIGEQVFATEDGGARWRELTSDSLAHSDRIDFVDEQHGWIATREGLRGSLLRTRDSGTTWQSVVQPCMANGYHPGTLSFVDEQVGWALCGGEPGTGMQLKELFRTSDGGQQWQSVARADFDSSHPDGLSVGGYLNAMFFLDATHGWYSAGSSGFGGLSGSSDGGQTWHSFNLGGQGRIPVLLRFISPTQGYVLLAGGGRTRALVTTSDGGATWSQLYPPLSPSGMVHFFDQQHGIATGTTLDAGTILLTADGGRSWTSTTSIEIDEVKVMTFSDPQHGCIEGDRYENDSTLVVYRSSDESHTWETASSAQRCTIESGQTAGSWRIDDDRLLFSADGGTTWTHYDFGGGGQRPRLVSAVDTLHAWYVDVADHLYVTSDGGLHWTQLN